MEYIYKYIFSILLIAFLLSSCNSHSNIDKFINCAKSTPSNYNSYIDSLDQINKKNQSISFTYYFDGEVYGSNINAEFQKDSNYISKYHFYYPVSNLVYLGHYHITTKFDIVIYTSYMDERKYLYLGVVDKNKKVINGFFLPKSQNEIKNYLFSLEKNYLNLFIVSIGPYKNQSKQMMVEYNIMNSNIQIYFNDNWVKREL